MCIKKPKGPGKQGHIVADTNVSPFARASNICCGHKTLCPGHKLCVRDTKNVSDFVQKHFVPATNVSQFAQPKKHHGQQYVRNNVSSFTRTLKRRGLARLVDARRPNSNGSTILFSQIYSWNSDLLLPRKV